MTKRKYFFVYKITRAMGKILFYCSDSLLELIQINIYTIPCDCLSSSFLMKECQRFISLGETYSFINNWRINCPKNDLKKCFLSAKRVLNLLRMIYLCSKRAKAHAPRQNYLISFHIICYVPQETHFLQYPIGKGIFGQGVL